MYRNHYRQYCTQRKAPEFKLLRGRFSGFAPRRGNMLHRWSEIWRGGPLLHVKFHPHRCNDKGIEPPKLNFLLRFDQNVECKPPLRDFHQICRICTSFQDALAVKISLNLLKGLWSYGRFKLTGSGYPQNFSVP